MINQVYTYMFQTPCVWSPFQINRLAIYKRNPLANFRGRGRYNFAVFNYILSFKFSIVLSFPTKSIR